MKDEGLGFVGGIRVSAGVVFGNGDLILALLLERSEPHGLIFVIRLDGFW